MCAAICPLKKIDDTWFWNKKAMHHGINHYQDADRGAWPVDPGPCLPSPCLSLFFNQVLFSPGINSFLVLCLLPWHDHSDEASHRKGRRDMMKLGQKEPPEAVPPLLGRQRSKWEAFAIVAPGVFMANLDTSIVNVSLPSIARTFETSLSGPIEWVVIAYLTVIASFLLPTGWLSDRMGRKRLWIVGLTVFTLGSVVCGAAPALFLLIAAQWAARSGRSLSPGTCSCHPLGCLPSPGARARFGIKRSDGRAWCQHRPYAWRPADAAPDLALDFPGQCSSRVPCHVAGLASASNAGDHGATSQ